MDAQGSKGLMLPLAPFQQIVTSHKLSHRDSEIRIGFRV